MISEGLAGRIFACEYSAELGRWGVFPAVRLNYRDHGLDRRAKEIILGACGT